VLKRFKTNELLHLGQMFESVGLGFFQEGYPLALPTIWPSRSNTILCFCRYQMAV
jgi:hypothetical protein